MRATINPNVFVLCSVHARDVSFAVFGPSTLRQLVLLLLFSWLQALLAVVVPCSIHHCVYED